MKHLGLPDCAEFLNRVGARIEFAASGDLDAAIGCQHGNLRSSRAVKNKRAQSKGASRNRQGNRHYLHGRRAQDKNLSARQKGGIPACTAKIGEIDARWRCAQREGACYREPLEQPAIATKDNDFPMPFVPTSTVVNCR